MLWILFKYTFGLVVAVVLLLLYRFRLHVVKGVPHPPLHPLLGHVFWINKNINTIFDAELQFLIDNGPIMQVCLPGKDPNIKTISPQVIKYILNDNMENFGKVMPGCVS